MPSHRFEQYGTHHPVINPCEDSFTRRDFSYYEYIARNYIQNEDNLTPSKYVSALSGGFKDPLIRDCPGQPVTVWITRLRWGNTLLRNTPYHLRDDELLSYFKIHVNPALARSARYDKETARECDLTQWISLIKAVEDSLSQPGETAAVKDAKKAKTPMSSIQTQTRKRSSSSADAQRTWLKRQGGCFKCQRVNVFHDIDHCPWGYPEAETYRGITLEDGVTPANPDRRETQQESSRRRYLGDDRRHGR
ncbi:hypothetical protein IW262DRAFT_1296126 [Armillaria fumosa]|nr:hypothetical protein IW262DRAFT_1296126 [Armillaria fumosa]